MSEREIQSKWQCGECDELHDTEYEAEECCRLDVFEIWICPACGKDHDEKQAAIDCCPISAITCPSCLRDHSGNTLEQSAITVSGHCTTCNPLYTIEQQLAIEDLHWQVTGKAERLNA